MSTKKFIAGYVREVPGRLTAATQKRALDAVGCDLLYMEGKIENALALLIRQRRPGDIVAVYELRVIADPKSARKLGGLRASLFASMDAIEDKGASFWEVSTDLRSTDLRQRDRMIRNAVNRIARSRTGRPAGRPTREFSAAELDIMRRHWTSLKHASNADAVKAMLAEGMRDLTPSIVAKRLGSSGRAKLKPK